MCDSTESMQLFHRPNRCSKHVKEHVFGVTFHAHFIDQIDVLNTWNSLGSARIISQTYSCFKQAKKCDSAHLSCFPYTFHRPNRCSKHVKQLGFCTSIMFFHAHFTDQNDDLKASERVWFYMAFHVFCPHFTNQINILCERAWVFRSLYIFHVHFTKSTRCERVWFLCGFPCKFNNQKDVLREWRIVILRNRYAHSTSDDAALAMTLY